MASCFLHSMSVQILPFGVLFVRSSVCKIILMRLVDTLVLCDILYFICNTLLETPLWPHVFNASINFVSVVVGSSVFFLHKW